VTLQSHLHETDHGLRVHLAERAHARAGDDLDPTDAAAAVRDVARTDAEAATREATRRTDAMQAAAKAVTAADDAAKAATQREQQAKVPADTAAQFSAKTKAEFQQATDAANGALEAMQAIAASQPKSETLPPVTIADIAAYAQVVGESDAAKRLFCRGNYTVGTDTEPETTAPVVAAAVATTVSANDAEPMASAAIKASAPAEPVQVTVPLPVARPSSLRR